MANIMRMNNTEIISKESMKRDPYWDTLKFILIFCVVVAHCVQIYKPDGGINRALFNCFLTILMPVFIFISGMFSQMKDRDKYKKGILRIFETYIIFQAIMVGMKIISALIHDTLTLQSIITNILEPQFALWYLLSLCSWRLILLYIPERFLHENPREIMLASILTSLLGGFFPVGETLSLQRTITYIPFFFMGYYANGDEVKKYIAKIPVVLAIVVLLSCFLIYYFVLNYNLMFILCGKTPYWSVAGYSPFELLLARGLLLIFATVTGFMLMRLTPTKPTFFSQWGRITLFIYVYHTFAIDVLRFAVRRGFLPQNEWFLILSSVFITMVLISLSQIKFLNVLLNPISYFKERKYIN